MNDAYHPFYCEENAWHRAAERAAAGRAPVVLFISGLEGWVLMFNQRAAGEQGFVVWDYHVVVLCDGLIFDPDCTAGSPLPADQWLDASFPPEITVRADLTPRFRWVPWPALRDRFTTDRSHMRDAAGGWLKPPPPWAPPRAPGYEMNLAQWTDMRAPFIGDRLDAQALRARLQ